MNYLQFNSFITIDQWGSIATFVLSVLALGISILSWKRSYKIELRTLEIEEYRIQEENTKSKKAEVRGELIRGDKRTASRLRISNNGMCTAKNILITLYRNKSSEIYKSNLIPDEIIELHPNAYRNFIVATTLDKPSPKSIRLEWKDESSEGRIHESGL